MVENDFYRVVVTDQNLLIYEEDELSYEYILEELLPDQSIGTPSLLLDEDLLYIGTDRLNVFDLYTEEITVFQNSTSGFNSILSGNINNLAVIIRENKKSYGFHLTLEYPYLILMEISFKTFSLIREVIRINSLTGSHLFFYLKNMNYG